MTVKIISALLFLLFSLVSVGQDPSVISKINESTAKTDAREDLYAVSGNDTLPARYGRPEMILRETYYYDKKKDLHKVRSQFQMAEPGLEFRSVEIESYFFGKKLIKQVIRTDKNGVQKTRVCYIVKGNLSVTGDDIPIQTWMIINDADFFHDRFRIVKRTLRFGVDPTRKPGTAIVMKNVSMSNTEVSVLEWISFIINNGFDDSLFPDSTKISPAVNELFRDLKKKKDFTYFTIIRHGRVQQLDFDSLGIRGTKKVNELHDQYNVKATLIAPITGITYDQAVQYCKWMEDVLNANQIIRINVQLPSIELYEKVITNVDSLNPSGCPIFNWRDCNCRVLTKSNGKLIPDQGHGKGLVRVDAYWPTELGLYTIQGNAAEMTSTRGVAMGGSFRHYAWESESRYRQTYSGPEDWLGFRYIITLR